MSILKIKYPVYKSMDTIINNIFQYNSISRYQQYISRYRYNEIKINKIKIAI